MKLIRITTVPVSLKVLLQGQLKYMKKYFDVLAVSSEGKALDELAEIDGIRTHAIKMTRTISPFADFLSILKMYFLFRKEKPDIVHSHTPKAGFVGMTAAWLAHVPHRLHTVAGLPLEEAIGVKRKILLIVEKITYRFANRVYPNSFGLKDFILSHKLCSKSKIKVIGKGSSNGIDTDYFNTTDEIKQQAQNLKKKYSINDDEFVFCFVGRIVKDKGIKELHRAFVKLLSENENSIAYGCKLLIVGKYEDNLSPISLDTKDFFENNSNIIMAGYQTDIRPFLELADAFVFPSYREGFPNVVMQAGCFGLPAIVTNINGSNEIITHGENGLIVEKKDSHALYLAMSQLINDKQKLLSLRKDTRNKIVANFDRKKQWEMVYEEYLLVSKNN